MDKENKKRETNANNVRRMAWICTAVAVCVGLYFTKDSSCLWAFWLPLFLS